MEVEAEVEAEADMEVEVEAEADMEAEADLVQVAESIYRQMKKILLMHPTMVQDQDQDLVLDLDLEDVIMEAALALDQAQALEKVQA